MSMTSYNDGVVSIYYENEQRSTFGAKQNVDSLSDMTFVDKFFYQQLSKRSQDFDFASGLDFKLSLKIKVPFNKRIVTLHKAVIDNILYDISYIDVAEDCLYLYLQEVRAI